MGLNISGRLATKSNKKLDTKFPIYLRIRTGGGSSETTINSGLEVEKKYWKNGSVSRKHPDYTNFVRYLAKVQSDVESIITELTEENKTPRQKDVELYEDYFETCEDYLKKKPTLTSRLSNQISRVY